MIRLGVIGYGRRIRTVLGAIDKFNAGTKVVAAVDPREQELQAEFPDKLSDVVFYPDADAMLDDANLDGVVIGTRCSLHTPYAVKALESNLPLFLEKPVAISWEQLEQLRSAWERSSSPVVVSFPLRVSAMCRAARDIIDSGAIGTVQHVQAVNNVPFYGSGYYHGWMRDDNETGGLWLQKATHDFDYINFLVRRPPAQICAMESKTVFTGDMPAGLKCVDCWRQEECMESPYNLYYQRGMTAEVEPNEWRCSFAPDTGNHDSASAIIRYESGIHAVYTQNFYARRGAAARGATIIGYEGTVKFDWRTSVLEVHHHHSNQVEVHRFEDAAGGGHHGGDKELAHDFIQVLTGKGASRTPLEAGLLSVRMCLSARDSCSTSSFRDVYDSHSGVSDLVTRA